MLGAGLRRLRLLGGALRRVEALLDALLDGFRHRLLLRAGDQRREGERGEVGGSSHAACRPRAVERRLRKPHGLGRAARMRPHRLVKRDEGGPRLRGLRHAVERAPGHDDGGDAGHLAPPFGQQQRLGMRRVMRVAMRAAEEQVIRLQLAGLHRRMPRTDVPGADDALRPEGFDCQPQIVEAGADLRPVGVHMPGEPRVVDDQRRGPRVLDDWHQHACDRIRRLATGFARNQHRRDVAGRKRLAQTRRESLRVCARRRHQKEARGLGCVRHHRQRRWVLPPPSTPPIRRFSDSNKKIRPPSSPAPPSSRRSPPGCSSSPGA